MGWGVVREDIMRLSIWRYTSCRVAYDLFCTRMQCISYLQIAQITAAITGVQNVDTINLLSDEVSGFVLLSSMLSPVSSLCAKEMDCERAGASDLVSKIVASTRSWVALSLRSVDWLSPSDRTCPFSVSCSALLPFLALDSATLLARLVDRERHSQRSDYPRSLYIPTYSP